MTDGPWIVVRNWQKFQHYSDRRPAWIKLYTELASDPDWLGLSDAERGLLVRCWIGYALGNGRVTTGQLLVDRRHIARLNRLCDAGFVEIRASKPLALARARVETETETEKERELQLQPQLATTRAAIEHSEDLLQDLEPDDVRRFASRLRGADRSTQTVLQSLRRQLPYAAFVAAYESVTARRDEGNRIDNEAGYYVATLQSMIRDHTYDPRGNR